jgi:HEAT repeat protein
VLIEAIEVLVEIGDKNATEPLCKILRHGDGRVRLSAVWALSKIGDERAIAPLRELEQHNSYREEIHYAIIQDGMDYRDRTPEYGSYLVRDAASIAIEKIESRKK